MSIIRPRRSFLPGILCMFSLQAAISLHGQIYYVRAGAVGSHTGSDWNNAYAALPAALQRGAIYYVADGIYPGYTFDDPSAGSVLVTVKKATIADHGTETGWNNTYGDGVARWDTWSFAADYYELDGQTGGGPGSWDSGFGFEIFSGSGRRVIFNDNSDHITIRHTLIHNSDNNPATASFGGLVASPGNSFNNVSDLTFSYCKLYHVYGPCFHLGVQTTPPKRITIEYTKMGDNTGTSTFHSEILFSQGVDDLTVRYCWLYQWRSTGGLIALAGPAGGTGDANFADDWHIYGNVFDQDGTMASWTIAAFFGGGSVQYARRWKVYNNTFIALNSAASTVNLCYLSTYGATADNEFKNNVIYGNTDTMIISGVSEASHNSYQGAGTHFTSASDEFITSEPFTNYAGNDFSLASETELSPGVTLEPPYDADMLERPRAKDGVWDRGAIEYNNDRGGSAQAPAIGTQPMSITVSLGQPGTFSVAASGSPPLLYQWQRDGADIAGASGPTYTTPATTSTDDGATFRVVVTNSAGSATSNESTLTLGVASNDPPAVAISRPSLGDNFTAPASIAINVTASDSDGSITKVEFFNGLTKLGEDTSSPYSFTWRNVAAATYLLTARATDNDGAATTSSVMSIVVTSGSSSASISIGCRVSVVSDPSLRVRSSAGLAATVLGAQPLGAGGIVSDGPIMADDFTWWRINYDSGPDGWSIEGSASTPWLALSSELAPAAPSALEVH